jgi:hypothetical protein
MFNLKLKGAGLFNINQYRDYAILIFWAAAQVVINHQTIFLYEFCTTMMRNL